MSLLLLFYVGHVYLFLLVVRDHKKSLFGNYHIISKQVYAVSLLQSSKLFALKK